uniref:Uncharacterized protein n=1 Tax=Daphnia galeata TaxID=27404 RepID=A0A8J2SDA4_9CRUS|nr:unnamed protein product [Daphnia galeata]
MTPKKILFQGIFTEIRHQPLLHLVLCLHIASKLEDGYKLVTVSDAVNLLQQFLRASDLSTIVNSEVLVFVTFKHEIDEISEVSMYFIRAIYFDQEVIIDRRIVAGLRLDESAQEASRKTFVISGVQSDKVLLAAGAITAAIFVIQPNALTDILQNFITEFERIRQKKP